LQNWYIPVWTSNSLQDSDCMSSLDSRKKQAMMLYPIPSHSLYTYLESQHSSLFTG
jgi:hypothetical protein